MPLPAIDLLPAVEAAQSTHAGGLDALTIDDSGARLRVASDQKAQTLAQDGVEALPGAVTTPASEPPVDSLPGRILVREAPPLAAGAEYVEDGVENAAERMLPRAGQRATAGKEGSEELVFTIREVARVEQGHAAVAPQSPFPDFSNSL